VMIERSFLNYLWLLLLLWGCSRRLGFFLSHALFFACCWLLLIVVGWLLVVVCCLLLFVICLHLNA